MVEATVSNMCEEYEEYEDLESMTLSDRIRKAKYAFLDSLKELGDSLLFMDYVSDFGVIRIFPDSSSFLIIVRERNIDQEILKVIEDTVTPLAVKVCEKFGVKYADRIESINTQRESTPHYSYVIIKFNFHLRKMYPKVGPWYEADVNNYF